MRGHAASGVGAVAALAAATGLVYALRPIAPTLSLGVVYTLAVLAVAVASGIGWSIAVSLASMLLFNLLFLAPIGTLTLADGRNWTALAVYVASGIVAGELAPRARRRAEEAEQRERETALLADVAAELLVPGAAGLRLEDVQARAEEVLRPLDPLARTRLEAALAALVETARERTRLELETRQADALRRSDAVKTTILQAVSHDFRTPLATMRAAADGLAGGATDADRAVLLETLRSELDRLTRLVVNLLDLSRLQAGAAEPRPELWTADELVAMALDGLPGAERVDVDVPDGLPPVRADATQLQRVLANLLQNALEFSPAASRVTVRARGEEGRLVVEVLDRGAGIDDAEAVLEPFVRGRRTGVPGTGLGLAIASGFAAANGATLSLEPRAGGGTAARVSLAVETIGAPA
jgi:two-component system sensor histidine kinase KdpD